MSKDVLCYSLEEAVAIIATALDKTQRVTISCRAMEGFILLTFWGSKPEL